MFVSERGAPLSAPAIQPQGRGRHPCKAYLGHRDIKNTTPIYGAGAAIGTQVGSGGIQAAGFAELRSGAGQGSKLGFCPGSDLRFSL